jgi:hypothetical protein
MKKTCEHCRFCKPTGRELFMVGNPTPAGGMLCSWDDGGRCQRFPEHQVVRIKQHWCGEFAPKEEEDE